MANFVESNNATNLKINQKLGIYVCEKCDEAICPVEIGSEFLTCPGCGRRVRTVEVALPRKAVKNSENLIQY